MRSYITRLFYFLFILLVNFKLTYANNIFLTETPHYLIDNLKLGEIDTLKISFPKISNIEKVNWNDLNDFFQNTDIEVFQLKGEALLKHEMLYAIQSFDLIDETFDSIPIKIFLNDKDTVVFLSLRINILNELNVEKEDFRDIKPILEKEVGFTMSELWKDPLYRTRLIIALVSIFLILIVLKLIRRGKETIYIKKVNQTPLTYIDFLNKIEELKNSNYIAKKKYKLFYTILSEVFRGYLEYKFKFSALEFTSDDLILALKENKILEKWMLEFIKTSDLVKFAKYIPMKNEECVFIDNIENFIKTNSNQEEKTI